MPAAITWCAPAGIGYSQALTGNTDGFDSAGVLAVGRSGSVPGPMRRFIGNDWPSMKIGGQVASGVITRAIALPPLPITTQAYVDGAAGVQVICTLPESAQVGSASPSETAAVTVTWPGYRQVKVGVGEDASLSAPELTVQW